MAISIKDITVLAIHVETYEDGSLRRLAGPAQDVKNLRRLLVENPATALLKAKQFRSLANPSSEKLREFIDEYALERSAKGDACLFYFSGHGVSIGNDDFGFCTSDTRIHSISHSALPLSTVKFSEVMRTFSLAGVFPILIIDACFSGIVKNNPLIKADRAFEGIRQITVGTTSSYCLLCSCSDEETVADTNFGGVFSRLLTDVLGDGKESSKLHLSLKEVFPELVEKARAESAEPMMQIGMGMPDIPLVKNTKYSPRKESFGAINKSIIVALWNGGKPRALTLDELGNRCGRGAYSNHSKLSLRPWQLVEDLPRSNGKKRRLTRKGVKFANGEIRIPKVITKDSESQRWVRANESPKVFFKDL